MNYENVSEVDTDTNVNRVNHALDNGWVLLHVMDTSNGDDKRPLYVIGRLRVSSNASK